MPDSMSINFDFSQIDAMFGNTLRESPGAARAAAQAGAQVFYDEVKQNVSALGSVTGNLSRSIYQAFSQNNSGDAKSTYHISWNYRKAPHGHLVENGHWQKYRIFVGRDGKWYTDKNHPLKVPRRVGAKAFLRRAYDGKRVEALQAARAKWIEKMQRVIDGDTS